MINTLLFIAILGVALLMRSGRNRLAIGLFLVTWLAMMAYFWTLMTSTIQFNA